MPIKRTLKFGTDAFLKKTPSLYRRIGNMFFSISSLGGTFAFLMEDKRIGIALFAMGVLGKALTEFFSEEEIAKDYEEVTDADAGSIVGSLANALPEVMAEVAEAKEVPAAVVETPKKAVRINPARDPDEPIFE